MTAVNKPGFLATDTEYHSICSINESNDHEYEEQDEPKLELGDHPQASMNRPVLTTILIQFLSLLWLVPILAMLLVNFKEVKIGASAWCPGGHCWVEAHNAGGTSIPEGRIHRFDRWNHNLLGGLQFVAKALEIWFELIAAALVYIVTMLLAGRKEGLPVGYLTRPSEFADMPGLFDPLLWSSLPRKGHQRAYNKRTARFRIWIFISMTLALCVLCNLMGPAVAVLVIPSLQWLDTPMISDYTFDHLNSAGPPAMRGFARTDTFSVGSRGTASECSDAAIKAYNYSCTAFDWSYKLDSWVTGYMASAAEGSYRTINYENSLTFTMNGSTAGNNSRSSEPITWVPNRQLVKTFNEDASIIAYMSQGYNASGMNNVSQYNDVTSLQIDNATFKSYVPYNSSLQLQVNRNGPILGAYPNVWWDNTTNHIWTTVIDSERGLHCFKNYKHGTNKTSYSKCIQYGSGWGSNTKYANFTIDGAYNASTESIGASITYEIFSSDRVAFFVNNKLPVGVSADCLRKGTIPAGTVCDWDVIFRAPGPEDPNLYNNVTTLRMTMESGEGTAILAVDFVPHWSFTSYTLDPSALTNPLLLVQTQQMPKHPVTVALHPAWTLAAWSVDNGGTLSAGRASTMALHSVMQHILDYSIVDRYGGSWDEYWAVTIIPVMQTLSLIEYETTDTTASKITKAMINDKVHPCLYRNADMYIWAYGISSRTAFLGITVASLGCLVVLAQFVLGIVTRRRYRSPTQLLVAALEHAPKGEFENHAHDEKAMARVRFHMKDISHTAGKFSFHLP